MTEYVEKKDVLALVRYEPEICGDPTDCLVIYPHDVEALPAADVVKVVRCKDCTQYANGRYTDLAGVCGFSNRCVIGEVDFCSYAERRNKDG